MSSGLTYQQMRSELEEIITAMESTTVDIDDASRLYDRGMELIASLEKYLKTAKNQVKKVKNLR